MLSPSQAIVPILDPSLSGKGGPGASGIHVSACVNVLAAGSANGAVSAHDGGPASMHGTTFRGMVHEAFQGAIDRAFPDLPHQQAVVAPTGNPKIADYQCNNAMIISGRLPQPPKPSAAPAENGQARAA